MTAAPLEGVRVLELGGIGPVPYCAMLLADMGAAVTRLERHGAEDVNPVLHRGRRIAPADLKDPVDRARVEELAGHADVLLEGFRPGVVERLGLGPEVMLPRHPRLVYGRITGFGRTGAYADRAGHDLNYLALSGVLDGIGEAPGPPMPPLNLVADFGGGGMLLALGVVAALRSVSERGLGQVVDATMMDGASSLMSMIDGLRVQGRWIEGRGRNLFDGGAPFYRTYECADGGYIAVAAIEPAFFARLLAALDVADHPAVQKQRDRSTWPAIRALFTEVFRRRTRDEWERHFDGVDACVTPVLSRSEAPEHPHNAVRGAFQRKDDGSVHPAPVPSFSGMPTQRRGQAATRVSLDEAIRVFRPGGL